MDNLHKAEELRQKLSDEIQAVCTQFLDKCVQSHTEQELKQQIAECILRCAMQYGESWMEDEIHKFKLVCEVKDNTFTFAPADLFSACCLFGRYTPAWLLEGKTSFTFLDDNAVFYDEAENRWTLGKRMMEVNLKGFTLE